MPKDELEDLSFEELLSQLTDADIEKLNEELYDPDDSDIPARDRCLYKLNKLPDGAFNRKKLLEFLEKTAKNDKDWPEQKPYTGEKKGKIWTKQEIEKKSTNDIDDIEDEMWGAVKDYATEEDLVEIAAILDIPSLISQPQYHAGVIGGDKSKIDSTVKGSGFSSVTRHEEFKLFEDDPPNLIDLNDLLEKIKSDDERLKLANLNNVKNISEETLMKIADALKENSNLEELLMANVKLTDKIVMLFGDALKENEDLEVLNVESNFLSGKAIVYLIKCINENQSVKELRVCNQRSKVLGYQIEMEMIKLLEKNNKILKVNVDLEYPEARIRLGNLLMKNEIKISKVQKSNTSVDSPK